MRHYAFVVATSTVAERVGSVFEMFTLHFPIVFFSEFLDRQGPLRFQ